MEIKQYTPKQPMSQRRNQKGNLKKNLKMENNIPNSWDAVKAILR